MDFFGENIQKIKLLVYSILMLQ